MRARSIRAARSAAHRRQPLLILIVSALCELCVK